MNGNPAPRPRHHTLKLRLSAIEYGMDWPSPSTNRVLNSALPGVVPRNDKSDDSAKTQPKSRIICQMTCEPNAPNLFVTEKARGSKIAINNPATRPNSDRSNIRAQYLTHGRTCETELTAWAGDWVSAVGDRSVAPQFLQKMSPTPAGAADGGQESFILAWSRLNRAESCTRNVRKSRSQGGAVS